MSDEAVAAVPGLPVLQYTLKHYMLYLSRVRERASALSRGEGAGCWWAGRASRSRGSVQSCPAGQGGQCS